MKLFSASLTLQGPECIDPMFSRSRIKRRGQREKVASSNRLPGFRIRAYSGRFFTGWDSSKERVCVARTNVFEISGEGSRQLKLFWASLTLQGPECLDPTFSTSRIKRRGQREKVVSSNRLPRFRFRDYSGRFFTSRILPKNRFVSREFFIF